MFRICLGRIIFFLLNDIINNNIAILEHIVKYFLLKTCFFGKETTLIPSLFYNGHSYKRPSILESPNCVPVR